MSHEFIDVRKLTARIHEVEAELAKLLHLKSFLGVAAAAKRGPKPKGTATVKAVKKTRKTKGKRGALSEKILAYLSTKGKEGANVKDIAAQVGSKPNNVTAFAYTTGKKKGVKHVGPGTFAYIRPEKQ